MPLSLEQFRGLMGIPYSDCSDDAAAQDKPPNASAPAAPPGTAPGTAAPAPARQDIAFSVLSSGTDMGGVRVPTTALQPAGRFTRPTMRPQWYHRWRSGHNDEAPSSIYYAILQQTKSTRRKFIFYDWIIYGSLILQLMLSAVLIVLGAVPTTFHIPISVVGAVQGVLTGILSILKGQGLPIRLIKYLESLRKVREDIEFCERELRMGIQVVTLQKALDLRAQYEAAREDDTKNNPDIWSPGGAASDKKDKPAGK
jgi:hypothetical protein